MPRTPRIDKPGLLYHVFARGIERRPIFLNNRDRYRFLEKLGAVLTETGTVAHAFALLPNHFHLLLRRNNTPLSSVMRRLLTSHAIYFNRRHERVGHLFQNRYRSIICQDDTYYLQLVRYIHLNPLRSLQVRSIKELEKYPFCGHSYLLENCHADWYEPARIFSLIGKTTATGKTAYLEMMTACSPTQGESGKNCRELSGVLKSPDSPVTEEPAREPIAPDVETFVEAICDELGILKAELLLGARRREVVEARELIVGRLVSLGLPPSRIANELFISKTAVTNIMKRCSKRVSLPS